MVLAFSGYTTARLPGNKVRVGWTTDRLSVNNVLYYGFTDAYGHVAQAGAAASLDHSVVLGPLSPWRTYHFSAGGTEVSVAAPVTVSPTAVGAATAALANTGISVTMTPSPAVGAAAAVGALVAGAGLDPAAQGTLIGRWRGDDITGLVAFDPPGVWTDASGGGNTLVQASVSNRFAYRPGLVNGHAAVTADGVDDSMDAPLFGSPVANPITVVAVCRLRSASLTNSQLFSGHTSNNRPTLYAASGVWRLYDDPGPGFDGPATTTAWVVVSGIFHGASSSLRVNNGVPVTGTVNGNPLDGVRIGNDPGFVTPFDGDIAEICLFGSHLGNADEVGVGRFMGTTYGIAVG